ncbi:HlyD family type I secretion periplasmic adaptor subunit [Rhodoligotrophos defluvii]|uniref:HlyD family type I secretion periplasmic adaptor subunit n=1 Tax=Rhodoligotrophos defluvii TaxID=2561934 RepID=UPI001485747C|nr:HlyD family type I secretion periplasmic adaptor subunit [Rhodoligotrophos defluvii]
MQPAADPALAPQQATPDLFATSEEQAEKALKANRRSLNRLSLIGLGIVGVFIFGAGLWASVAPLASAAMAPGVVSPEGYRRTVQHLEGGIIQQILVEDGAKVHQGQLLMVLDATQDTANLDIVQVQRYGAAASLARLDAEVDGRPEITYPDWLIAAAKKDQRAQEAITSQERLFKVRRENLQGQRDVLQQTIAQLEEQRVGRQAEAESAENQLKLFKEELKTVEDLVKQGYERRSRLLEMQRSNAQFEAQASSARSALASTDQQIGEYKLRLLNIDQQARDQASSQRAELEKELANLDSKLASAADVLSRTQIVAPIEGTVVNLRYHTVGGVVAPGSPILDIVPDAEKLIIDVRISPMDIDVVHVGESCLVKFTAYKQRSLPRITGKLIYVSPDAVQEPNSGQSFYAGKVEVSQEELGKIRPAIHLVPGMPAEAAITTGERTVMRYILDPLIASLQRSFVED